MGFGYSKKESQQQAAKEALLHIRKKVELYHGIVEQHEQRIAEVAKNADSEEPTESLVLIDSDTVESQISNQE